MLFRQPATSYKKDLPNAMEALEKKWNDWAGGIASQGKLADRGIRLAHHGQVLKAGGLITDGPFVEVREILGGFMVVRAADYDEAVTLAHGCPVLENGGSVEIRPMYED
mgnify:CR=1 FL=1